MAEATNLDIGVIIILSVLVINVASYFIRQQHHTSLIKRRLVIKKATLKSRSRIWGIFSVGPFKGINRYNYIYYFRYIADGEEKTGWVKFNLFHDSEWRFDTKGQ